MARSELDALFERIVHVGHDRRELGLGEHQRAPANQIVVSGGGSGRKLATQLQPDAIVEETVVLLVHLDREGERAGRAVGRARPGVAVSARTTLKLAFKPAIGRMQLRLRAKLLVSPPSTSPKIFEAVRTLCAGTRTIAMISSEPRKS